ncbi:recombinase family protein [Leclercia sp. GLN_9]|uniref:recombinase family protein n=1 Tax=Leclercia sp. GLN_9 TaxID=3367184 RepID=UPI00370BCA71
MYRPICYERVSSFDQVLSGSGLDDQRSIIEQFLDDNPENFTKNRIYITDEGVSAFKNANISAESNLGKFLQDVRGRKYGKGDALIVTSLDRLSRRSSWSENTIQFIVTSDIVIYDISTGLVLKKDDNFSKILMEIILQRSHNESLMKSVRAKVAWQNKINKAVANGDVVTSRMPFWLENVDGKYSVIKEQAELIVNCFNWYVKGLSTGEIIKKLNKPKWHMVTVSRLIRDRRLLGEHKRSNDEAVPNVYPIIVDSDLFVTANRMMDSVMIQKKKPAEKMEYVPEVVEKIFQLYDTGVGTGAIVKQIPSGWSTVNVLRVLRDKDVVEQRIIDNLTFERVNLKLSKNGVANRIRKDIKIAADDYITNLFPRILKCGCCNGNIAIHYNHVRAKYVICRNREEKKSCNAKSFQYIRIEENILKVVKNVDFQKLMNEGRADKSSILDSLRIELSSLREEEKLYQEKIAERKAAGKKASIAFMEGLTDVQDRIDELEDRLSHEQVESEIPAFDFNLYDVLDPTNVELRAKVRKELRLVLSSVKYILDDKRIFISLKYFNEVLSHLIVINNKRFGGEVLQEISITEKNGERIYDIKELGKTVFRVVVTIDAYDMWTLSLSRDKTVEAVGPYLDLLKRENLDLVVNEDQIEWID